MRRSNANTDADDIADADTGRIADADTSRIADTNADTDADADTADGVPDFHEHGAHHYSRRAWYEYRTCQSLSVNH